MRAIKAVVALEAPENLVIAGQTSKLVVAALTSELAGTD
jgi:hypothetical protein